MTTPLPPTDPSAEDDKLPGEAELAALYRQLPRNEPGPALDAAVLRAAAQAIEETGGQSRTERRKAPREPGDWVHPKSPLTGSADAIPSVDSGTRMPRQRVPHWLVGLGSAASLVLVAGLAWHMRSTTTDEPAQANRAMSSPQVAASPQARQMTETANAKPAADVANQDKRGAMVGDAVDTVASPGMHELAAAPPPPKIQPSLQSTGRVSSKASNAHGSTAAAAKVLPAPAPPLQEISAQPVAAPPPAPAAPPSPAVAAQITVNTAVDANDTPAQELDKIQQLFTQGHDDEGHQRLRDFRQAHPRWPLPPALQAQLPKP